MKKIEAFIKRFASIFRMCVCVSCVSIWYIFFGCSWCHSKEHRHLSSLDCIARLMKLHTTHEVLLADNGNMCKLMFRRWAPSSSKSVDFHLFGRYDMFPFIFRPMVFCKPRLYLKMHDAERIFQRIYLH